MENNYKPIKSMKEVPEQMVIYAAIHNWVAAFSCRKNAIAS